MRRSIVVMQIVPRQLDDDTAAMAARLGRPQQRGLGQHGRAPMSGGAHTPEELVRLGSRIAGRFSGVGLTEDVAEITGQVEQWPFAES